MFTAPSGKTIKVPGFYDGDGSGGLDGTIWKVRFAADEVGQWSFHTRITERLLDGRSGTFTVTQPTDAARGFYRWGRLEAVGTAENRIRYLKSRDGPYWLKAGCDDPENFLGAYKNYDTLEKRKAAVDYLAQRGINSFYVMSHNIDGDDKDVCHGSARRPRKPKPTARGKSASIWRNSTSGDRCSNTCSSAA